MIFRFVLLVGLNLMSSCVSLATDSSKYIVLEEFLLSQELKETSGLYCPNVDSAYTINDSGNNPVIYNIDYAGRIQKKISVDTKNSDWEALTGDSDFFYIGDVGNNNGQRKFVQVHVVPNQSSNSENNASTLKLSYINNVINKNKYLDHDFDAEALISLDDNLLLFSKSWNTGTLFIYQLNKTEPIQLLEHVAEIKGLPGIVTGGDFDSKNNRFILVGYKLNRMKSFTPFITILNKDLSLQTYFELLDYDQVEGVCVTPNGEVWFTQEGSFFTDHKLVKLRITL